MGPAGVRFHAFLAKYRLKDPALRRVGAIVLAADNGNLAGRPGGSGGLAGDIARAQPAASAATTSAWRRASCSMTRSTAGRESWHPRGRYSRPVPSGGSR